MAQVLFERYNKYKSHIKNNFKFSHHKEIWKCFETAN